jgi:small GTP-binding protein
MSEKKIKRKVIRITMLGDSAVGKTSLISKFLNQNFDENYLTTIGKDKLEKKVVMKDGNEIKLIIWDTAGQERFHSIATSTIKGSHGIILTFDLTKRSSFNSLESWLNDIKENSNEVPVIIFGNKCDLFENYEVENEEAKKFAKEHNLQYFETSAKQNVNVQEGFNSIAEIAYEKYSGNNSLDLNKPKQKPDKRFC